MRYLVLNTLILFTLVLYIVVLTKTTTVMKHLHFAIILAFLLFLSPVVYASVNTNSIKVLEPINKKSITISSSSEVTPPAVISSLKLEQLGALSMETVQISSSSTSSSSESSEPKTSSVSPEEKVSSSQNQAISSLIVVAPLNTSSASVDSVVSSSTTPLASSVSSQQPEIIQTEESPPQVKESKTEPESLKEEEKSPEPEAQKVSSNEDLITFYCEKYGCSTAQLTRVMKCESGGNPKARNGIHIGLFQFNPATFRSNANKIGLVNADIWNREDQIQTAAYMFSVGQAGQWSCK